jgi:class 3 adenylate cyclase/predicted ATPase
VRCPSCGYENPQSTKFCGKCGAALKNQCVKCNSENPPEFKFCGECGASLTAASPQRERRRPTEQGTRAKRVSVAPPSIPANADAAEGERKTVTALFADIKGSTELARDLDPEDVRAIVDPVLQLMMAAVHRYDGYVAQSTGDGIFALFGAPVAHEDHPQRALHAALAMQEELRRHTDQLKSHGRMPIEIRIGINTGEVVVRTVHTGGHAEYAPVGHTANLAARMQTVAPVGSIAASEVTRRLCEGYFTFRDLGQTQVKGISQPVRIHEVTGLGRLRTHFQLSEQRGFTKFVGREHEMAAMRRVFEQAVRGHGQVAAIVAEAGTGKSRMVYEFKTTLPAECKVLEAYSVSHGKASAWQPVLELLWNYFSITDTDDTATRRRKLEEKVVAVDSALNKTLPYLYSLMGLAEGAETLAQMTPQVRRRRMLDALRRIIIRESLNHPLVLIFEDLHWVDYETQALLDSLVDAIASARILLLVNYRPEYRHNWAGKSYYTQFSLAPLGAESTTEMLDALLGSEPALRPLKTLIAQKIEGNPFFIEEIVQALFEQGTLVRNGAVKLTRSLAEIHIPPTVQGILASRIDRLAAEVKELLQTLAVIGKNLPLGLIRRVTAKSDDQLERMLSDLQTSEFIYEQPALSEPEYAFKHALTQEVAYNSLLIERRKILHERTANQIEALFKLRLEDHYGDLARHYRRSENRQKAVEYLRLAGQQAAQRSAHAEAVNHLTSALDFLKALPDTTQRSQQELALQMMLGPILIATRGNGSGEVGAVYERALELGRQVGEDAQLFPVLFGLRSFHLIRGELQPAFELAQQLVSLAESVQDSGLLVEARLARGNSLFLFGKLIPALEHMERAISLYDPQAHHVHAFLYGLDPGVFCLAKTAWLLELLGHSDQASNKMGEALALAHRQSHAFSLAVALMNVIPVLQIRREWSALLQHAEAAIAVCREQGFESILAQATMYRGYALAQQGQTDEGIALMRGGLDAQLATGAGLFRPSFLCFLAEAYETAGRFEEGLAAVAEAIAIVEKTDERHDEADFHRLKGDLVFRRSGIEAEVGVQTEAEECFRKAIEIARQQDAKSFELKAVTSLSRLWKQQGKKAEARQALVEIYGWFNEGFETKDLKDAKVLLEQLS